MSWCVCDTNSARTQRTIEWVCTMFTKWQSMAGRATVRAPPRTIEKSGFLWRIFPSSLQPCGHLHDAVTIVTVKRAVQEGVVARLRGEGYQCYTDNIHVQSGRVLRFRVHVRLQRQYTFNTRSSPYFVPM